MKSLCSLVIAVAAALSGGTASDAALIASADFESNALGSLNGQGGGTGFSGTWGVAGDANRVNVVSSALSYANGAVSASGGTQALQFTFDPAEGTGITDGILSRALSASLSGTVYMSLLFRETANNESFTPGAPNDFIQWGFDQGTDGNPNASIMRRNGELQSRSNTAAAGSAASGLLTALDTTRLLVFRATHSGGNYNAVSIFIDPNSLAEPAADATSTADSGIAAFDHFIARSAFHELNDAFQIDNIRIGDSWGDVVIPEPSAAALLGLACLHLLRRRRSTGARPSCSAPRRGLAFGEGSAHV